MDKRVQLTGDALEFFQYFIMQYNEHIKKGEVSYSHHCAIAVLLELENMINWSYDEYCPQTPV